jgi:glutathione S-transferase
MLTIYGTPASRTFRVLWMAHELGLDYSHRAIDFRDGGNRAPDYLALNPNGGIPAIRDGDFVLWESLAINLYLARKHPGPLTPATLEEEMLALQWSLWAVTAVEHHAMTLMYALQRPPEEQDHPAIDLAREAVMTPLTVLEGVLAERAWLLGERFTVADLNVAGVIRTLRRLEVDFTPLPHVDAWLDRCLARPAAVTATEMQLRAMAELEKTG